MGINPPAFVDSCQDLKFFLIARAITTKSFVAIPARLDQMMFANSAPSLSHCSWG